MKTLRRNVFETNSSSSHSITVEVGSYWDTITPDNDGVIRLIGGEFGWEIEEYNDAETKANYVALDFLLCEMDDKFDMLIEVIQDYTGYHVENCIDLDSWGTYIDHQSIGTAAHELHSKDGIKNFIFNKSSILYTDNDNH